MGIEKVLQSYIKKNLTVLNNQQKKSIAMFRNIYSTSKIFLKARP